MNHLIVGPSCCGKTSLSITAKNFEIPVTQDRRIYTDSNDNILTSGGNYDPNRDLTKLIDLVGLHDFYHVDANPKHHVFANIQPLALAHYLSFQSSYYVNNSEADARADYLNHPYIGSDHFIKDFAPILGFSRHTDDVIDQHIRKCTSV